MFEPNPDLLTGFPVGNPLSSLGACVSVSSGFWSPRPPQTGGSRAPSSPG